MFSSYVILSLKFLEWFSSPCARLSFTIYNIVDISVIIGIELALQVRLEYYKDSINYLRTKFCTLILLKLLFQFNFALIVFLFPCQILQSRWLVGKSWWLEYKNRDLEGSSRSWIEWECNPLNYW